MRIVASRWNKYNLPNKISSITEVLDQSGEVKVRYFRGRPYLITLLLGEGGPTLVSRDDNWNKVKITYNKKHAIEIFLSIFGPDGHFFDQNFTEKEIQTIKEAFSEGGMCTWDCYILSKKIFQALLTLGVVIGFFGSIVGYISGNIITMILFLGIIICNLLLLFIR